MPLEYPIYNSAVMNFLSALAVVDNGVREVLPGPIVRYISQYVDFEFNAIWGKTKEKVWYVQQLIMSIRFCVLGDSLTRIFFLGLCL